VTTVTLLRCSDSSTAWLLWLRRVRASAKKCTSQETSSPLLGSWWASDFCDPSYNIVATRIQSGKSRM
jgi:hypothetical protein